jgi:anti-sigma factor RsiW
MDCSQFKSTILDFSDGKLSEEARQLSERHVASCASCTRILAEFNNMAAIIEKEKTAEPNPYIATRILQHIENELKQAQPSVTPAWLRVLQPVAIAIALLCGIFIGSYTANQDNAPATQMVNTSDNIEFLKSNLFISEFADEDKILVLNN